MYETQITVRHRKKTSPEFWERLIDTISEEIDERAVAIRTNIKIKGKLK